MKHITIHCSATVEDKEYTAQDIHRWHLQRGWSGIGYHYVVLLDGKIEKGRPVFWKGAHVKDNNIDNIGIVYIGGLDKNNKPKDTRTKKQKRSLQHLLTKLKIKHPQAIIKGHRDFSEDQNNNGVIEPFEFIKDCPCFDAKTEYKDV